MTPQQAFEKRYGIAWYDAKSGQKEIWMAAWTIAWVMSEAAEREACVQVCENISACHEQQDSNIGAGAAKDCAEIIRSRGDNK